MQSYSVKSCNLKLSHVRVMVRTYAWQGVLLTDSAVLRFWSSMCVRRLMFYICCWNLHTRWIEVNSQENETARIVVIPLGRQYFFTLFVQRGSRVQVQARSTTEDDIPDPGYFNTLIFNQSCGANLFEIWSTLRSSYVRKTERSGESEGDSRNQTECSFPQRSFCHIEWRNCVRLLDDVLLA